MALRPKLCDVHQKSSYVHQKPSDVHQKASDEDYIGTVLFWFNLCFSVESYGNNTNRKNLGMLLYV